MTIAKQIALLRKQNGWSQAELARKAELSPSTIAMYETNRRTPDDETLKRLAETLGVTVSAVLGEGTGRGGSQEQPGLDGPATPPSAVEVHADTQAGLELQARVRLEQQTRAASDVRAGFQGPSRWRMDTGSEPQTQARTGLTESQPGSEPHITPGVGQATKPVQGQANSALNLQVSVEEARVVLAMRMSPSIQNFLTSYVSATEEERARLERTWHVIQSFQSASQG